MKKIAAALCVVPLFLSLNLISVSADPSVDNSVNEITALEQEILELPISAAKKKTFLEAEPRIFQKHTGSMQIWIFLPGNP